MTSEFSFSWYLAREEYNVLLSAAEKGEDALPWAQTRHSRCPENSTLPLKSENG